MLHTLTVVEFIESDTRIDKTSEAKTERAGSQRFVRVGQPVHFRIWPQGLAVENVQVNFGDGRIVRNYRPYTAIGHRFKNAGIHVVTVTSTASGLPVTQKVKVHVREQPL